MLIWHLREKELTDLAGYCNNLIGPQRPPNPRMNPSEANTSRVIGSDRGQYVQVGRVKLEIIEFPGCIYSLLSLRVTVPSGAPGNTRFYHQATREPSGNHQSQEVMQSHVDVFRPNLVPEVY